MADLVALEQETGLGNPGNSGNWEIFGNCEMCGNSGDVGKPNFPNYGKLSEFQESHKIGIMQTLCQNWHLDWIGLTWIGLDWVGLDWIGLD